MSAAILAAAEKKGFGGMAAQIVMARKINEVCGTSLAPWELEELPADWLTGLEMWIYEMPKVINWQNQVQESLERLRSKRVH